MGLFRKKIEMPDAVTALSGREAEVPVPAQHFVNSNPMKPPFPAGMQQAIFGLGCFWGAERKFWEIEGVYVTAAGYAGGFTKNPLYEEVCSGQTAHTEVVLVVYDPELISFESLLAAFWEGHDPTQGMRQGNDVGTQYRSAIFTTTDEQTTLAEASRDVYQASLKESGYPPITTEIGPVPAFYYAEHYHQQYLAKVPNGYCGLGGTGVCYSPEKA